MLTTKDVHCVATRKKCLDIIGCQASVYYLIGLFNHVTIMTPLLVYKNFIYRHEIIT